MATGTGISCGPRSRLSIHSRRDFSIAVFTGALLNYGSTGFNFY
jgi:hypothetical protein